MSRDPDPSTAASMPSRADSVLGLLLGLLPDGRIKRQLLNRLLGWDIDHSACLQPCIMFRVGHVSLGPHSVIHAGSVYRNLDRLTLAAGAVVGSWNWVAAAPALQARLDSHASAIPARLSLARDAAVTSRHYIDCSGGVTVGAFAVVAGVRSTVMTHQVDTERSEQVVAAVHIGEYSLVNSNVKISPGSRIPDRCVIAMGSVVVGILKEPGMLYAGVPARPLKPVGDGVFFRRRVARADIP